VSDGTALLARSQVRTTGIFNHDGTGIRTVKTEAEGL